MEEVARDRGRDAGMEEKEMEAQYAVWPGGRKTANPGSNRSDPSTRIPR